MSQTNAKPAEKKPEAPSPPEVAETKPAEAATQPREAEAPPRHQREPEDFSEAKLTKVFSEASEELNLTGYALLGYLSEHAPPEVRDVLHDIAFALNGDHAGRDAKRIVGEMTAPELASLVAKVLAAKPKKIAAWLRKTYPETKHVLAAPDVLPRWSFRNTTSLTQMAPPGRAASARATVRCTPRRCGGGRRLGSAMRAASSPRAASAHVASRPDPRGKTRAHD